MRMFCCLVVEEANWLTLEEDLEEFPEVPRDGFDAVLCLGNSFAHLQVQFITCTLFSSQVLKQLVK